MTFVAANRIDYGFRSVQYLQKRTKRLEVYKDTGFFFFTFLAENSAHREGHYDEDTS